MNSRRFMRIGSLQAFPSATIVTTLDLKKANSTIGVKNSQSLCYHRKMLLYPYRNFFKCLYTTRYFSYDFLDFIPASTILA